MWTDLICSKFWLSCQLHFFRGMQIVHRIFHLYFHHPVITSAGCLENSETIYSTDNGRNWLVPSRKCTSRNVELIGSFFVRSIFVKRYFCQSALYFFFRSLRYAFFLWSFWTQYTSKLLSFIKLQSNQI